MHSNIFVSFPILLGVRGAPIMHNIVSVLIIFIYLTVKIVKSLQVNLDVNLIIDNKLFYSKLVELNMTFILPK